MEITNKKILSIIDDMTKMHYRIKRSDFSITPSGVIDAKCLVEIPDSAILNGELKLRFNTVRQFLLLADDRNERRILNSFNGFPRVVSGDNYWAMHILMHETSRIKDLTGFTRFIHSSVNMTDALSITDLTNCHKHISMIEGDIALPRNISKGGLGLLMIRELKGIHYYSDESTGSRFERVQEIFNRHLKGDKDVLACQEELINTGLKEFARL